MWTHDFDQVDSAHEHASADGVEMMTFITPLFKLAEAL